mmetsp:Transcript_23837/g.28787  ORF Transcript_23837/g.28787 Transcript_23837/m.28787 type:complete len:425 (+) Transcript_23837:270-1544(+)|eukprot:CAMPEP_0197857528 /NCGR_PEP_ID=MMETSP1438-20131217/30688_1 /TAXON_ID=1461541 /ORGANISM="Pterosperma sp., Strain CCMP1384" /LENGTH=424 /DNA_ID=CAMNT_0043473393 /DNA_START=270 /DNA_END=1544 /DNA_ORIENTATION=+
MAVTIDGYLKKRNAKTSVIMRNWNKRWFSLSGDTLSYSKNPRDKSPSGTFNISDVVSVNTNSTTENEFEVVFPEKTLLLRADDVVEATRWTKALSQAQLSYSVAKGPRNNGSPVSTLDVPPSRDNSSRGSDTARDLHSRERGGSAEQAQQGGSATPNNNRQVDSAGARDQPAEDDARQVRSREDDGKPSSAFGSLFNGGASMEKSPVKGAEEEEEETEVLAFDQNDTESVRSPTPEKTRPPPVRQGFNASTHSNPVRAPKCPDQMDAVVPANADGTDGAKEENNKAWLHDNWDSSDDEDGHDNTTHTHPPAPPPKDEDEVVALSMGNSQDPRKTRQGTPGSTGKQGWGGEGEKPGRAPPVPVEESDIRPITPNANVGPTTPKGNSNKGLEETSPKLKVASPPPPVHGPAADTDWLEEDWDSDEE